MRLLFLGAMALAVLVGQAKPNFSGTWTLAASDSPAAAAGVNAVVVVLTQTDSTLTLKNGALTMVIPLDGSEATVRGTGPNARDVRLRTRWDGERLVVEQRTETTLIVQTVSLSSDGKELTIEGVAQGPEGEHREKQLFKKSS